MNSSSQLFLTNDGIYVCNDFDTSTKQVQNFYKISPFPNYEGKENKSKFMELKSKNQYVSYVLELIGNGKDVIEVGAGTCQFTNMIASSSNNRVIAFDATYESLKLGKKFSDENDLPNTSFVQGDIANINNIFKEKQFDIVICSGVLHHTSDPYSNFSKVVKLLKKDGIIILGLYNKYGRIYSKVIKFLYKMFGKKILKYSDPVLNKLKISNDQKQSWIQDQYDHPIESTHTFGEVKEWLSKNNLSPFYTIPFLKDKFLNNNQSVLSSLNIFFVELSMNFSNLGYDGGLFVVIAKNDKDV